MKQHRKPKHLAGRRIGNRSPGSRREPNRGRPVPSFAICLLLVFLLQTALPAKLQAFSISKSKIFTEGDYTLQMEIQISGRNVGKKRGPFKMSSLKVKIKNKRASSDSLKVRAIRVHLSPNSHQDMETKGYSISPGQWVTKYFRLPEENRPIIGEEGYIEIVFDHFTIRFNPRDRTFQEPSKN